MKKSVNILSKVVPALFTLAAILNLIFNNEFWGFEGNIILNAAILFLGTPMYQRLCREISKKTTPKTAVKLLIPLGADAFVFLLVGFISILTGKLDGVVLYILLATIALSSVYFLYLLYLWKYYGLR